MSHPVVLHTTLGPELIGLVVASTLYGVSIVQAWYYYGHQNDTWALKSLVGAVMALDTIHQAFITQIVYIYAVTFRGAQLETLLRSGLVEILFIGLVALLVQSFFILRIISLVTNGNIWLTGIAALLTLAQFACVLVFYVLSYNMTSFLQLAKLNDISITATLLAAVTDSFIAAVLCILLHRSRTGFQGSNNMINRLIFFAVSTGALTSLCAIATLTSFIVAGNASFYAGLYFCLCRLYTNSLFATLNARKMILRSGDTATDHPTLPLREIPNQRSRGQNISNQEKEFVADLTKYQDHDMDEKESENSNTERFDGRDIV